MRLLFAVPSSGLAHSRARLDLLREAPHLGNDLVQKPGDVVGKDRGRETLRGVLNLPHRGNEPRHDVFPPFTENAGEVGRCQ